MLGKCFCRFTQVVPHGLSLRGLCCLRLARLLGALRLRCAVSLLGFVQHPVHVGLHLLAMGSQACDGLVAQSGKVILREPVAS